MGDTARVEVSGYFEDPDGDSLAYEARAANRSVATASISGSVVSVEAVGEGTVFVTVTASDPGGLTAEQRFWVTVRPLSDREVLIALYEATNGPNWLRSDNWLTDAPLGEWAGVETDGEGRVIRLGLFSNLLAGPIPPELGKLSGLRWLYLIGNRLSGSIPPELGHLSNLKVLNLHGNALTGAIPPELGKLSKLETLRLHGNALTGAIPPELGKLSKLEHLCLHGNALTGAIPPELGKLSKLETLRLHGNALTGAIPPELGKLSGLRWLYLSGNRLAGQIPPEIGAISNLISLALASNRLTGPIPPELGQLSNLEALGLSYNGLTGSIPSWLAKLSALGWLDLRRNQLAGSIPPGLGDISRLFHLDLSGNELTGSIPPELGKLSNLRYVSLLNNRLTGPIPPELGKLSGLYWLGLFGNELTGAIPPELGKLSGLGWLYLFGNRLTGPIPPELGELSALQWLDFRGNRLTGPLPPELGRLSGLIGLILADNRLSGPVPREFGGLTSLTRLDLTNNAGMSGALPAALAALGRLEELMAGGTRLCAPSDEEFLAWLESVPKRRVSVCGRPESMAYLTQAVQSRTFPVPLVAGEAALLRVFVTATRATGEGIPPVRATFHLNGAQTHVVDIAGGPASIPTEVEEGDPSRSANAEIPGRVVRPGLEMVVEIDPDGTLDPGLLAMKRIPETGRMEVEVRAMPKLDLTLIPFLWSPAPDSSIVETIEEMAADPLKHELLRDARTLLPVGDLEVRAHDPVVTSSDDSRDLHWETRLIQATEGETGHYMGMMSGSVTGATHGAASTRGRTSFSVPDAGVIAHQLGHNFSLLDAPCGGADRTDPSFPEPDGSIGSWGYDFLEGELVPPGTPDLMSLCGDRWIGDYHFTNALRFRVNAAGPSWPLAPSLAGRAILLWGGVDGEGDPFLEPAFIVDAPPALPPSGGGRYEITGRTGAGAELFSLSFDMPEVADGDGRAGFVFALPVRPGWSGDLESITLSGPGGSATLDRESDHPAAILLDARTGRVRGILRDLPPGPAARATVAALSPEAGFKLLLSRGIPGREEWRR